MSKPPLMISKMWYKGDGVNNGMTLVGENIFKVIEARDGDEIVAELLMLALKDCYNRGYYLKSIRMITKEEYEKLISGVF